MNFFHAHYDKGLGWYRDQMPRSYPGQITIEKSPWSFMDSRTPARIHQFNKTVKLILVVRDPVSTVTLGLWVLASEIVRLNYGY